MYFKYAKTRDVKDITHANAGDAGIDFYVPNTWNGGETLVLAPGDDVLIPSGIKVEVQFGYALVFFNKSGISTKRKLDVGACVVDHGYAGEVHLHMFNFGNEPVTIAPGDKIVQGLLIPVISTEPVQVNEDELYKECLLVSGRGTGGFGSTGSK